MIDSQLCWMTINYRQFCQFLMPSLCHGHKNGDFIWTYLMRWVLQSCKVSHFTEFLVQLWMWNLSLDHSTELMTSSRNCLPFLGTRKGSHKQVRRVNQEAVGGRRNYGCLQSRQYCLMFIRDYRTFQQTTLSGAGTFALIFSFIMTFEASN
jgi:hypothetical protein